MTRLANVCNLLQTTYDTNRSSIAFKLITNTLVYASGVMEPGVPISAPTHTSTKASTLVASIAQCSGADSDCVTCRVKHHYNQVDLAFAMYSLSSTTSPQLLALRRKRECPSWQAHFTPEGEQHISSASSSWTASWHSSKLRLSNMLSTQASFSHPATPQNSSPGSCAPSKTRICMPSSTTSRGYWTKSLRYHHWRQHHNSCCRD